MTLNLSTVQAVMHGLIRNSGKDTSGIMGVDEEDTEGDKMLQWQGETSQLSHRETHSICVSGCLWQICLL